MMSATLEVSTTTTRVVCAAARAREVVKQALRYRSKGYWFSPAYQNGHWDGYRSLLTRGGTFPTGLLPRVEAALTKRDIPYCITVLTPPASAPQPKRWQLRVDLRDYQEEAVAVALKEKRGIFQMATGSGKTEVMIAITAALGLNTLVLVTNRDLALQTAKRFSDRLTGAEVGVFGAGRHTLADVTIATFQALRSFMRADLPAARAALAAYDVVHSDECHQLPTSTYLPLVLSIPAQYRFGWSATPFKKDDRAGELQLIGATGKVIIHLSPEDAVQAGTSVPTSVTMLQWASGEPMASWPAHRFDVDDSCFGSYAELYRKAVVENAPRNAAVIGAAQALAQAGRPTLVLVTSIEHGAALSRELSVPFAHGSSDMATRKNALQALRDGSEHIIIASTIFDQGIDVPELSGLVIAGGGKAHHVVVQRVGRGSRTSEGKERLEVIDLFDTHSRILWRHAKARRKAYKDVGADVEVVRL